ncbi:12309_t:CDS:2 [Entrophospora sp. SA101]|nr:12309_t:CDS:2 [Entrophospora sp. SA101]
MNEAKYVVEFFGRLTMVLSLNLTNTSWDLQSPSMKEKMRTENRDTRETNRPDFALINNSGYELIMLEVAGSPDVDDPDKHNYDELKIPLSTLPSQISSFDTTPRSLLISSILRSLRHKINTSNKTMSRLLINDNIIDLFHHRKYLSDGEYSFLKKLFTIDYNIEKIQFDLLEEIEKIYKPGEIDKNMGIIRINHKFSIDTFSERQKLFIISMVEDFLLKFQLGFFKSDFMNEAKYVVEFFGRLTMVLSLNLTNTSWDLQSPSMKEKMRTENRDTRETNRPDFALINNSGYELIMLEVAGSPDVDDPDKHNYDELKLSHNLLESFNFIFGREKYLGKPVPDNLVFNWFIV